MMIKHAVIDHRQSLLSVGRAIERELSGVHGVIAWKTDVWYANNGGPPMLIIDIRVHGHQPLGICIVDNLGAGGVALLDDMALSVIRGYPVVNDELYRLTLKVIHESTLSVAGV